jgi:hypothetical protein
MNESNYETLEEAQEALKKAYTDFVGYYIYQGEGYNAFEKAQSMVADQCELAKEQIIKRIKA